MVTKLWSALRESKWIRRTSEKLPIAFQDTIRQDLTSSITAYNSVLSLGSPSVGFAFLLVTFVHPNIAIAGLLALGSAFSFLALLGRTHGAGVRGMYFYNSLLVGLFIGYLFELDAAVVFLIMCSACFTLLLTFFLDSILKPYLLPVLSLPFVIVSGCIALSAQTFTNLSDATPYFLNHSFFLLNHIPALGTTLFRSLGTAFCIPDPLVGLTLLLLLTLYSPMTAMFLVLGFLEGYLTESYLTLNSIDPLQKYHYFNYSLIFTAIAGVFLIPSRISMLLATVGTLLATLISASALSFWSFFHIPILSLPYNAMVLLILRTIRTVSPGKLNSIFAGSPERNLDLAHLQRLRYRSPEIGIFCPFEGTWTVQQSFDGEWTHQGNWRHALDFVIKGKNSKTYEGQGYDLTDYYAFGKSVLSPADGYIVNLRSSLVDHPIGQVDNQNNWGNFVVIKSLGGIYILLAHLKHDSVSVKVGDFVTLGQQIGLCGNTGYSREPHLHLQVQLSPELGYYTTPFHLLNYKMGTKLYFHGVPKKECEITPIQLNRALYPKLVFSIGDIFKFELRHIGKPPKPIQIIHQLDPYSGIYYWTDGKSRLYYSRSGSVFYFYGLTGPKRTPLWDLFVAAPRIPLTYGEAFSFSDIFSLQISDSKFSEWRRLFWKLFSSSDVHHVAKYEMDPGLITISGIIKLYGKTEKTFFRIDPALGIQEFKVGQRQYVRVP